MIQETYFNTALPHLNVGGNGGAGSTSGATGGQAASSAGSVGKGSKSRYSRYVCDENSYFFLLSSSFIRAPKEETEAVVFFSL